MIMFTGSTETGTKVAETRRQAADPGSLELGGKDPMIVLSDADVERAANSADLLLDAERRPDVHLDRARLRRGAGLRRVRRQGDREGPRAARRQARQGPGSVEVGAITFPPQLDTIKDHVADAVAEGRTRARPAATRRAGARALLRADGARRRRPHDEVHDRGDLRPDAADHEGRRRRGGRAPGQRLALRPRRLGVLARHRARRGDRPAPARPARPTSTTR